MEWTPVDTGWEARWYALVPSAAVPAMPVHVTAQGRELLAQEALPTEFPSKISVAQTSRVQKRRWPGDSWPIVHPAWTIPSQGLH